MPAGLSARGRLLRAWSNHRLGGSLNRDPYLGMPVAVAAFTEPRPGSFRSSGLAANP